MTMIDVYTPTIGHDSVEVRVVAQREQPAELRVEDGDWLPMIESAVDAQYDYFRYRLIGLEPHREYRLAVRANGGERELTVKTLACPTGRLRARFGIAPDLHLRGGRGGALPHSAPRIYDAAEELAVKYLKRMENESADFVILPGDTLDPMTDETLAVAKRLFRSVKIPCRPIIGNHELADEMPELYFCMAFGLPPHGYHAFTHNDVRFVLLHTPEQDSLAPDGAQWKWLREELEANANERDTFIFSHFSALLHRCVLGPKNDGMQQLTHYRPLLEMLGEYTRVRAWIAGHKNVPSLIVRDGVLHMLTAQFIQAPCGWSMMEVYEDGVLFNTFEIEEMQYSMISRRALGDEYAERYGQPGARNFWYAFER